MNPKARHDGLLIEEVGDDLAIYDRERDRACHLNRTAALVWRRCDGNSSVAQIVAHLREVLAPEVDEELVLLSLDRLREAQLLDAPPEASVTSASMARRTVVTTLAFLIPVVAIVSAPEPAHAQSLGVSLRPREDVGPRL